VAPDPPQLRRILIVDKVYPSYSKHHAEVACTGGIQESDGSLVRLFPIPYRHLEGDQKFKKFQWIECEARPDPDDRRPGTLRIHAASIKLGDAIDSEDRDGRRKIIGACKDHYASVEALENAQNATGASLGIVRPAEILQIKASLRSEAER